MCLTELTNKGKAITRKDDSRISQGPRPRHTIDRHHRWKGEGIKVKNSRDIHFQHWPFCSSSLYPPPYFPFRFVFTLYCPPPLPFHSSPLSSSYSLSSPLPPSLLLFPFLLPILLFFFLTHLPPPPPLLSRQIRLRYSVLFLFLFPLLPFLLLLILFLLLFLLLLPSASRAEQI